MNTQDFSTVYTKEFNHVCNYVTSKVTNRIKAEDIAQQTFQRLFENLHKYNQLTSDKAIHLLFHIANNIIIDNYRKNELDTSNLDDIKESNIIASDNKDMPLNDLKRTIAKAIYSLKPIARKVFILHYYRGLKTREIATKLNMNHNTIRKIIFDNKLKLKKLIEPEL